MLFKAASSLLSGELSHSFHSMLCSLAAQAHFMGLFTVCLNWDLLCTCPLNYQGWNWFGPKWKWDLGRKVKDLLQQVRKTRLGGDKDCLAGLFVINIRKVEIHRWRDFWPWPQARKYTQLHVHWTLLPTDTVLLGLGSLGAHRLQNRVQR